MMQLHLLHVWRLMVGREALGFHGGGADSGLWQAGGTSKKMQPHFPYFFLLNELQGGTSQCQLLTWQQQMGGKVD